MIKRWGEGKTLYQLRGQFEDLSLFPFNLAKFSVQNTLPCTPLYCLLLERLGQVQRGL